MSLVTWRRPELNRLFDRFVREMDFPFGWFESHGAYLPALDIVDEEGGVTVTAELPGMEAEQIDLSLRDDVLTISGEKKSEHEETKEGLWRMERSYGSFRRAVRLPQGVDPDSVKASMKNGVLTVTMSKQAEEPDNGRKIEVKADER